MIIHYTLKMPLINIAQVTRILKAIKKPLNFVPIKIKRQIKGP